MEYMPLKGDVLFKSTTWLKGSHEGRCAALRLWWHSFGHEVPAASLPDDDQLLAEHAGYGEVVKAWLKIKPQAMRGWILCSDGRWYHKTVAELALEAWKGRLRNREKVRKWREKKAGEMPSGNGVGNGISDGTVTVTEPVRNRLKGEGESKGELRIEKKDSPIPSLAQGEASDFEPVGDHAPEPRPASGYPSASKAKFIEQDWQPSEQARADLRKSRPDITPETFDRRMVEFRAWCASNAITTFNPDASWLGFMVKTHAERSRDQSSSERSVSAGLAGFAEGGSR